MAQPYREAALLAVAKAYQDETGFHLRTAAFVRELLSLRAATFEADAVRHAQ